MRILLGHNRYRIEAGEDNVFDDELALLQRRGHEVECYIVSNKDLGIRQRLTLPATAIWSRRSYAELLQVLSDSRPSIAHFTNTFPLISPSAYYACRKAGVPVVQALQNYRLFCPAATFFRNGRICEDCAEHSLLRSVVHGCYRQSRSASAMVAGILYTHRRLKTWSKAVDAYVVPTNFAREKFISLGLPESKLHVKPNFVHPDPGIGSHGGGYFLYAGRLSTEKGVSTLLAAWADAGVAMQLVIAGDGPERPQLEQQAKNLGIGNIDWRGFIPRSDVLELMKDAYALVLPTQWYEGLPLTMLEAYATGLPVVASAVGPMPDVVEKYGGGLLFETASPDDLREKITLLALQRHDCLRLGREARQAYVEAFSEQRNYEVLMGIYRKVISSQL